MLYDLLIQLYISQVLTILDSEFVDSCSIRMMHPLAQKNHCPPPRRLVAFCRTLWMRRCPEKKFAKRWPICSWLNMQCFCNQIRTTWPRKTGSKHSCEVRKHQRSCVKPLLLICKDFRIHCNLVSTMEAQLAFDGFTLSQNVVCDDDDSDWK